MTFVYTDYNANVVTWTAVVPTVLALVAAVIVLCLAVLIYRSPETKGSLDRQSIQMLLWVQVASLVYNGAYLYVPQASFVRPHIYRVFIFTVFHRGEMLITGPTKWCNAVIILTLFGSRQFCYI